MKRILSSLLLILAWSNAQGLSAQEPIENELDFVRQLRVKGWTDMAKAKIEALLKRNDPTLNAALPLESARIDIAAARQLNPEQRFVLFTEARAKLQDFIKKNQGKVQAAQATVELARLTSYHAQALLSQAMREDDDASKHEKARPAETMFIQAGKDLEIAAKTLEQAVKDPKNAALKKILEQELQQARFDAATNFIDQARTYLDSGKDSVNRDRSLIIDKAKVLFKGLSSEDSAEISYLANAWSMKCAIEHTDPPNALKYYTYLLKKKDDPAAQSAIRLAKFFYIQDMTLGRKEAETIGRNIVVLNPKAKKLNTTDRLHAVQKECEAWMKAYSKYHKTYEGQGVLFEYAYSFWSEASMIETEDKKGKKSPENEKAKKALMSKAVANFKELAKLDSDLAERARGINASLERATVSLTGELKTFGEYLSRAMILRDKVREVSSKLASPKLPEDKKALEAERKAKLKEVITSLSKGMALVEAKTPVNKVDEALYYLAGAYLTYGDLHRGAIVAEALARQQPPTRRSPEGAATAIATYAALQQRQPDDAVVRARLQDLADYVLTKKTWASDPVTSLAHYHLALMLKKDNRTKEAILHLEKIAPNFTDYIYTQGQLVFMAQDARENLKDAKEQQGYMNAAKSALQRMPKFNIKEDSPSVISMYFFAKIEMSKFQYAEAMEEMKANQGLKAVLKCNEMKKYVKDLLAEFESIPAGTISKKSHDQLEFTMHYMLKYADYGIAESKFRGQGNDRFDEVLTATNAVVNEMLAIAAKTPADQNIKRKDYRVTGDILGLALRANVQKGDVEKGKAILNVLQRLRDEGGHKGETGNVVAALLNDIAGQIRVMKENKDSALQKTKGNYSAFLDAIAKEFEDKKSYDNNSASMLAHAYLSLDFPAKAADTFSKIKPPADLDKKFIKKKVETDKDLEERQKWEDGLSRYWSTQIEYVRALRACKEKDSLKTAESVLNTMLKHPEREVPDPGDDGEELAPGGPAALWEGVWRVAEIHEDSEPGQESRQEGRAADLFPRLLLLRADALQGRRV